MLIFSSLIGNIFEFDGIQQAIRYIQTIGFSDLLDVAIIAFIIYRLILLMRNSQAGQVIKGVLLVIVLLGLSDLFNLHVLNFLLNSVVQIGILALIGKVVWGITKLIVLPIVGGFLVLLLIGMLLLV